ncbi:hypothetical protein BGZ57DRAFT_880171 [Hyaloscypha finlandica]|nr:hypothetical protein BGZ57DRAFT_880171 [Hyaloscypha finlandica]
MLPSKSLELLLPRLLLSSLIRLNGVQANIITPRAPAAAATTASPGDLATVSITAAAGYQVAGACIQESLFWDQYGIAGALGLPAALGCYQYQQPTVYNGCYCTSAVASKASSAISVYVSALCAGTAQIPDAISIYKDYCTSAGYPSTTNANVKATQTTTNIPGITVVTNNVVYTVTVGSSTYLFTAPGVGVQTLTSSPSQASSSSGGGNGAGAGGGRKRAKTGAIVGGVIGGLLFLGALGAICVVCIRRMKRKKMSGGNPPSKLRVDPQATFVPLAMGAGLGKGGGRAELGGDGKGGVVGRDNLDMSAREKGVEMDGRGVQAQRGGEGRYGLRPEELDGQGRYVGELHGDGRQGGRFELQGSEVVR